MFVSVIIGNISASGRVSSAYFERSSLPGLTEKSKGNESYIDLLAGGRLDKVRQEKLKRFRESLTTSPTDVKNEDQRILLSTPWKDNGDFQSSDSDHQRYLRTLNASIFLRIKSSNERFLDLVTPHLFKASQQLLYNEALVHSTHCSKVALSTCLGFERFIDNDSSFRRWLTVANTAEHYPYMIFGARASGKSLLSTKIVQYLVSTLGKNSQCIVRYLNLTSRSRHIVEVFSSICAQMSSLQPAPADTKEQLNERIEYYQSALQSLSKSQKPLILMIDGIEEMIPQGQQVPSTAIYHALLQLLPPKVSAPTKVHASTKQLSRRLRKQAAALAVTV